jgi:hypothetical protein
MKRLHANGILPILLSSKKLQFAPPPPPKKSQMLNIPNIKAKEIKDPSIFLAAYFEMYH